ncbi:NfeD family protein [Mumia sp. DW29H23]|uniref:NfeD family protein n=1 Tax=Mumia sp. DW29H23 TaxID=3421241 RepID=UPI003D68F222
MTVFLILGLVGLALLVVSLVVGEVLDGVFDALPGDVFSTAVIGGFVSAFGFGAAASDAAGLPLLGTLAIGVACGVVVGWFAAWLTGLVRGGGSDGTPATDDSIGRSGRVVTAIPDDGLGTVRIAVGGHVLQLNARADAAIDAGTEVHVTDVLSPTAVRVARVWDELP